MHFDWSVHKLLEGRDTPIRNVIATVSFAVEPQKPMGEMLPDFLVVRGAYTASKHLDANDHLRASASYGSSSQPLTSAPPTKFGIQPLPPKLLYNFLTICKDFAVISSLFCLSLLCWETEKATSVALFV